MQVGRRRRNSIDFNSFPTFNLVKLSISLSLTHLPFVPSFLRATENRRKVELTLKKNYFEKESLQKNVAINQMEKTFTNPFLKTVTRVRGGVQASTYNFDSNFEPCHFEACHLSDKRSIIEQTSQI